MHTTRHPATGHQDVKLLLPLLLSSSYLSFRSFCYFRLCCCLYQPLPLLSIAAVFYCYRNSAIFRHLPPPSATFRHLQPNATTSIIIIASITTVGFAIIAGLIVA